MASIHYLVLTKEGLLLTWKDPVSLMLTPVSTYSSIQLSKHRHIM